jgi:hypothetical protein
VFGENKCLPLGWKNCARAVRSLRSAVHFTLARFLAESSERQLSYLALMKPNHPTTGTDKADWHLPTCKNIARASTITKPMNETARDRGRTLPPKAVRSAARPSAAIHTLRSGRRIAHNTCRKRRRRSQSG